MTDEQYWLALYGYRQLRMYAAGVLSMLKDEPIARGFLAACIARVEREDPKEKWGQRPTHFTVGNGRFVLAGGVVFCDCQTKEGAERIAELLNIAGLADVDPKPHGE